MIEFSSSLKRNEIHVVESPFNEDSKNIYLFQGGPNFWGSHLKNTTNTPVALNHFQ